ncbi:sulfurtransferase complex subunit TusB [Methylomagnum sp.]
MAALHLVNRSPADSRALAQCLARAGEGDALLLIEGGVYAAADAPGGEVLRELAGRVSVYVLAPDLDARGLSISPRWPTIQAVDYSGFVALTTALNPIVSWF